MHRRIQLAAAIVAVLVFRTFACPAQDDVKDAAKSKTETSQASDKDQTKEGQKDDSAKEKEKGTESSDKPKDQTPPATAVLHLSVTAAGRGIPAKVFVANEPKYKREHTTNSSGLLTIADVPQGTVLIQVFASDWATFGKVYEIREADRSIEIELKK
jgi:hypothetical protein